MLTVPRSCLLAAQTIYESKNVAVEGFPQAAVIDKARFRNVYNANAERLEDEQVALDNHKLWQLVTVPAEAVRQCEHYGVEPEEAEAGAARAAKAWADFFELFFGGVSAISCDVDPTDTVKIITLIINDRIFIFALLPFYHNYFL